MTDRKRILLLLNSSDVLKLSKAVNSRIFRIGAPYQDSGFKISFNTPVKYTDTVPHMASRENLPISKVRSNSGKQTIAYTATSLWNNIPTHHKNVNAFNLSKQLKFYLLSEKHSQNSF